MKDSYKSYKVLENEEIFENIYRLELEASLDVKPGQFFMLRAWKGVYPFLSRPISISDVRENSLIFLYERRGQGTDLFSNLKTGDEMEILWPLGNGFEDIDAKKIALVSGGVGIAPLLYLA